jgi:tetratricopeptide (TPR) repeat protein
VRTDLSQPPGILAERKNDTIPRLLIVPPRHGSPLVDVQDHRIALSLVTDVTLSLCRSRLYEVIAPYSAMKLTSGPIWEEMLPADYVVLTDVVLCQRELPFALMSIDVVATDTGRRIYRSEVELRSGALQCIHDSFCAVLADKICGEIGAYELQQYRRTGAASAYVHYLIAMQRRDRNDLTSLLRAQKSLERSIQLSPDFAPALAQLARTKTLEWLERGSSDRTLLHEARHLAQRAYNYEPNDSASLREIGHATLYLHDLPGAHELFEAAHEFAPNHADLLVDQADVLTHLSRHDEAEAKISRALSLNPLAPDDYYWIAGAASFFRGEYQQALTRLSAMETPGLALRLMAACAAMLNDKAAAAAYREQALARDPGFTVEKWQSLYPAPKPDDTAHYLNALLLAGFSRGT